jgi:hypothetical protein
MPQAAKERNAALPEGGEPSLRSAAAATQGQKDEACQPLQQLTVVWHLLGGFLMASWGLLDGFLAEKMTMAWLDTRFSLIPVFT